MVLWSHVHLPSRRKENHKMPGGGGCYMKRVLARHISVLQATLINVTMSELWGLVYIESHVTLQVKAEAQKVNYICLLHSFVLVLLQYEILYFLHSYVIKSIPQELYIFHGRLKLSWFFKPGMFSVKIKTTSVNRIPQKTSLARRASKKQNSLVW